MPHVLGISRLTNFGGHDGFEGKHTMRHISSAECAWVDEEYSLEMVGRTKIWVGAARDEGMVARRRSVRGREKCILSGGVSGVLRWSDGVVDEKNNGEGKMGIIYTG